MGQDSSIAMHMTDEMSQSHHSRTSVEASGEDQRTSRSGSLVSETI